MTIDSARVSENERTLLARVPKGLFIAGEWRDAAGGATFGVEDPATGDLLAHVADASAADGATALEAARAAQSAWAATPPRERSDILDRAYHAVVERIEDFALVITLEMGKPLAESRGEVRYAADFLKWFSEQAVRIRGDYRVSPDGQSRLLTLRQPVGPSLLISPWNFPLAMITRKVAPALAAGCTAVLKPAEDTPLTCQLLAEVLSDSGLPPGVLSVLPTSDPAGLVGPMLADERLRKVSFTGSTAVGQNLLIGAAQNVLRTSMELGGNSAFLVFDDADLDAAVEGALLAKLRNGGESCVAANRILVQSGVADEFAERLADRISQVKVGRGTEPGTQLGPMINREQRDRVQLLVDDAVRGGATVVTGGSAPDSDGYFYEPTVITGVSASARITHEEVFGPVAPVYTFDTENEALRAANDTRFGLVSYAYTRDIGRALRVAEGLEAGMVGVNRGLVSNAAAPFGGVKQSGLGREGGFEGIDEYLSVKYVAIDKP
jgi:succinate-semialdehyde dehydrogenase/glutarate-semialdehyde dehydrogenase